MSVAQALRVYAHNNNPDSDPTSYILEGRLDSSSAWTVISQGNLPWINGSPTRNARGQVVSSTYESGDANLVYTEVSLPGKLAFEYKLTFPSTRGGDSPMIQFAEVELPGVLLETETLTPTVNPTVPPMLTRSPTILPTQAPTPAPTSIPTASGDSPTDSPTRIVTPDISLQDIGNNGYPSEFFPLGQCQGDCDNDADCQVRVMKARLVFNPCNSSFAHKFLPFLFLLFPGWSHLYATKWQ